MAERSWVQTPTVETIFHALGPQSMEAKIEWKLIWHCNPAKGRVDFEDGCLIKIQLPN